ncbi:hypothetical protein C5S31_05100 [ANME-1 cluster archaeon GoMg2]|nr:hypothetical protein [ANME-1 cluster archaeon GoMg2]
MNKTKKIAILGIAALFTVLTVSTVSAAHATFFFDPQNTSVPEGYCNTREVKLMINITTDTPMDKVKGGQVGIRYNPSRMNITGHPVYGELPGWGPNMDPWMSSWNAYPICCGDVGGMRYGMVMYGFDGSQEGVQHIATFEVHCNSTEYCETPMLFGYGKSGVQPCPIEVMARDDRNLYPDDVTFKNGTFTCGAAPPPETFEKELVVGWNMISLPLYNETDMTVANIIADSLSGSYSDLYKYDAVNNDWVLLSLEDKMQKGVGYFIYMTAIDTWIYSGLPYNRVEVSLSEGLNCIGWTNTSASINVTEENALGSITDKYNYVAQWNNAPSPKYEVYEQHAPDMFNDFWMMERGEGYWIAAKEDCTLTYA